MHDHDHAPGHICCQPRAAGQLACPGCRTVGKPVSRATIARFVDAEALASLGSGEPRFCPHPRCAVAYYAPLGAAIPKDRLSVRIGLKETEAPRTVCYCFDHTVESLAEEFEAKGSVSAVIEVMAKVRAGECRCEELNPSGACCLPELRRAVLSLQDLPLSPDPEPEDACGSCSDTSGCSTCGH